MNLVGHDKGVLQEASIPRERTLVRASVWSIDHGVGLASQFVMQSPINQPSHDLGRRLSVFDDVIRDGARFPHVP
jgi:hypothetical protein